MADVARDMGVAQGTLYGWVESKDALFWLVIDRWGGDEPFDGVLPVVAPTKPEILARVRERMVGITALPRLAQTLGADPTADVRGKLAGILEELWDVLSHTALAADMVERSARDWPDLSALFYTTVRGGLLTRLADFLDRGVRSGRFLPMADSRVGAQLLLETITWFARHRFRDPESSGLSDPQARQTVIPLLVNAVVGGQWKAGRKSLIRSRTGAP